MKTHTSRERPAPNNNSARQQRASTEWEHESYKFQNPIFIPPISVCSYRARPFKLPEPARIKHINTIQRARKGESTSRRGQT